MPWKPKPLPPILAIESLDDGSDPGLIDDFTGEAIVQCGIKVPPMAQDIINKNNIARTKAGMAMLVATGIVKGQARPASKPFKRRM